ncbi:DUF2935 domain-containing protein, partial [Paenibacillus forsythiae]
MLYKYGPPSSVRILEEIRFWKNQEKDNAALVKLAVPELKAPFVKLMDEWAAVFAASENAARSLLERAQSPGTGGDADPAEVERLAEAAREQSREFIRHLNAIQEQSPELRGAAADTYLTHVIRETEYFLGILKEPGYSGTSNRTARDASGIPSEEASSGASLSGPVNREAAAPDLREPASVPIGGHKLPPLPYPYNALEPYIDEKTMRIHHDKHHQSYVDGLNKAEKKLADARKSGDFDLVKHWERELAFNGAGHYLHTIFWDEMSPHGGGRPTGALLAAIERDFGSYNAFKKQFSEAAEKVEGG